LNPESYKSTGPWPQAARGTNRGSSVAPPGGREHNERGPRDLCGNLYGSRDDLAKVAGGAVSTFTGLKAEIEVLIRQQIERFLLDADMVPRDEFDAVKELAANARSGQEALDKRVLNLERKLGVKVPSNTKGKAKTKKTKPKKQMKKKSSAKGKRA